MAIINRASLPEEFMDITSAMLLVQPEPQYLHAQLFKMALGSSLNTDSQLGFLAERGVGGLGAGYSSPEQNRLVLDDPIMRDAIAVNPELAQRGIGHTVRMNRPKFADTTYTEASRQIASGATISTTPIDIQSEQVAITVKKWAGPYDQTNANVAPFSVDRFDAKRSVHSLAQAVGTQLKRDHDKFLDKVMISLFDAAANVIRPTGFSADNDSVVAGDAPMDFNVITRAEQKLDELGIPTFSNGKRVMVLSAQQLQQLKNDAQFARYAEFHPPVNPLLQHSYQKSVAGFDIYKSTTLTTSSNSSSVSIHYGQAFGPGMVGVGLDELPRVAYSTSDDYGERALVVWIMYAGWVTLDNRFGVSIRTS